MKTVDLDVVVVGGGIAGLWLLARLRALGYAVVLIESDRLGSGQTIRSQGIIHGGTKYALQGAVSSAASAIADMPALWRRCLTGEDEVDLKHARLLSHHQYLITGASVTSKLTGFFASKVMSSRMQRVAGNDLPQAMRNAPAKAGIYRLDEPVLDTASVLQALADNHAEALLKNDGPNLVCPDGTLVLRTSGRDPMRLRPRRTVYTAGVGNEAVADSSTQRRPLHMVMVRGPDLPKGVYLHCLGTSDAPRLTVTSHRDEGGRIVWYIGGQLAEAGVDRDTQQQIAAARREIAESLPWIGVSDAQFATLRVFRAEARQSDGRRPDIPGIIERGQVIAAWPTKLAMAPILVDQILALLARDEIRPRFAVDLATLSDWPRPTVANLPWNEATTWY